MDKLSAYQLANYWMNRKFAIEMADETCDMLRQQADRIAELEDKLSFYELKDLDTHPVKQLSDEEIKRIFKEQTGFYFDDNPADDLALMDFARAIIKEITE